MIELERQVILDALVRSQFDMTIAAKYLEMHRNSLTSRCRRCDIDVKQLKKNWDSVCGLAERVAKRREYR